MGIWMGKSGDSKGIIYVGMFWDILFCLAIANWDVLILAESNGFQWSKIICFISPRKYQRCLDLFFPCIIFQTQQLVGIVQVVVLIRKSNNGMPLTVHLSTQTMYNSCRIHTLSHYNVVLLTVGPRGRFTFCPSLCPQLRHRPWRTRRLAMSQSCLKDLGNVMWCLFGCSDDDQGQIYQPLPTANRSVAQTKVSIHETLTDQDLAPKKDYRK